MTRARAACVAVALACSTSVVAQPSGEQAQHRGTLDRYCVTCHNQHVVAGTASSPLAGQLRAIGLTLDTLSLDTLEAEAAT